MHGQRCTQAIGGLIGVVTILSLIFDSPTLLIPGVMLALLLGIRAVSFTLIIRSLGQAISIDRRVRHRIIRQGNITQVSSLIHYHLPYGTTLIFEDILPQGAVLTLGRTTVRVSNTETREVELQYSMKLLSRGSLRFGGLSVTCADVFFQEAFILGGLRNSEPSLHVQPSLTFEEGVTAFGFGIHEMEKAYPVHGQSIRSFRPFVAGDDEKAIDWKLSAKYNRLILREYMGSTGGIPLVVLDLPQGESIPGPAPFDQLIATINRAIEKAIQDFRRCDVLIISGGYLIRSLSLERDAHPWYRLLNELVPGTGNQPFYHFLDAADLRSFQSLSERMADLPNIGTRERTFFTRLATIYGATARTTRRTVFESQLEAVYRGMKEREIVLYTLAQGDTSHLRVVIAGAQHHRLRVHIRVCTKDLPLDVVRLFLSRGARTVEAIS